MDIQEFLTYFINTLILSSIIFFLLDFCFYLFNSWQQLNPSTQPDFYASCPRAETVKTALAYQQVKEAFWDKDSALGLSTT